jgi:outer membrane protein OmpA-like peptidoglycan-associated protein
MLKKMTRLFVFIISASILSTSIIPMPANASVGPKGSLQFTGNAAAPKQVVARSLTAPGTGEFTYETWVKTTLDQSDSATADIVQAFISTRSIVCENGCSIEMRIGGIGDNGAIRAGVATSGSGLSTSLTTGTGQVVANRWYHVAFVRALVGGTYVTSLYLDGVLKDSSSAITSNLLSTTAYLGSKGDHYQGTGGDTSKYDELRGFISNIRISNTAEYRAAFTPSTGALVTTPQTQLLLNTTNDSNYLTNTGTKTGVTIATQTWGITPTRAYPAKSSDSPVVFVTANILNEGSNTGWNGNLSINNSDGNPAPSIMFSKNDLFNTYYSDSGADFAGTEISFDVKFIDVKDHIMLWWGAAGGGTGSVKQLLVGPATNSGGRHAAKGGLSDSGTYNGYYQTGTGTLTGTGNAGVTSGAWSINTWYTIKVVISATSSSYYLNGTLIESKSTTLPSAGWVALGGDDRDGYGFTNGVYVDNISIKVPKITPTLSWANQTKTMGDEPYALTAPTPSTPGTFTYSSATPGVIAIDNANAENATIVGVGTSIITASFTPADTATYSSVTTTMTITVNKMLQSAVSITLSPTTKVIKSGFSQVLTTLSGSGGSGTGTFSYSVSTVTAGANCALANNAGTYTLSADTAGICTLTATKASDASYQAGSASTNFTFSTPVRTLSFATTAYSLPYLATQQVTAAASAHDGPKVITYSAGVSTACTVGANTGLVSITASTGTCSISASIAEDVIYLATSTVTPVAITVGKATQTPIVLTISPTSKNGTAPFSQQLVTLSTTGGTGTGVLAYTIADVTAGATCQLTENAGVYTVTAATAGTCSITATKPADSNYLVSADSKTFSFNSNRTLTYAAGLGGGVKSGVTAPTAGPFLTGDTFAIAAGSAYERAGFSFAGWSDGTNTFAAGDNYTVASADITLTAQWRQTSLFGILDADLEEMQSWNASNRTNSGTISNAAGTSSVTVTVPANSLTTGTTVKLWELRSSDFAKSKVDATKDYIVNLVLSWLKDNGVGQAQTVPTASTPITLSISNNTIKKGAIAYQIIGDAVTQIGTATSDGVINLSITEDPVISIANPIVEAPNNGGGGGGTPVAIIENSPDTTNPIGYEKPVTNVPSSTNSHKLTHKVFFGMNASWINSANIKSLKSFLTKVSQWGQLSQIHVEGFTQPTKLNPDPAGLSTARAKAVAKYVKSRGLNGKILTIGRGNTTVNSAKSRYVLLTITRQ